MQTGDVIVKPWGYERIVDLNDRYCIKHIVITQNQRLSKQYHERKRETMILMSGAATVTLFDRGATQDVILQVGEPLVIEPRTIHRVKGESHNDAVIMEISSPELEDVVRLEDDYGR